MHVLCVTFADSSAQPSPCLEEQKVISTAEPGSDATIAISPDSNIVTTTSHMASPTDHHKSRTIIRSSSGMRQRVESTSPIRVTSPPKKHLSRRSHYLGEVGAVTGIGQERTSPCSTHKAINSALVNCSLNSTSTGSCDLPSSSIRRTSSMSVCTKAHSILASTTRSRAISAPTIFTVGSRADAYRSIYTHYQLNQVFSSSESEPVSTSILTQVPASNVKHAEQLSNQQVEEQEQVSDKEIANAKTSNDCQNVPATSSQSALNQLPLLSIIRKKKSKSFVS